MYKDYHFIRSRMNLYAKTVEEVYRSFINKGIIPKEETLREKVKELVSPKIESTAYHLDDYIRDFIDQKKASRITEGRLSSYRSLLADLVRYQPKIKIESVGKQWIQKFQRYLYERKLEQNTISKKISDLRFILDEALEDGHAMDLSYQSKRIKAPRVNTSKIYLSEQEIEALYELAGLTQEQEEARDVFVVMCYTGVRISDAYKISRRSFIQEDEAEYFGLHMKKTRQPVNIPVHPMVRRIMEKYDWELPTRSRQRFSDHLKILGKLAGINQQIEIIKYPAGVMTITYEEKYTQITPHTARVSLACNMLLAGVPDAIVMEVGGWRSYKSFSVYKRLTASDKLKIAARSSFFQQARVIQLAG